MGAWGHGPLENDGASDFVYGIEDKKTWKAAIKEIKQIAKRVKRQDEIFSPDGEILVAAAALIAHQRGRPVDKWVGENQPADIPPFPPKIIDLIRTLALRAIQGPGSELRDLWQDTDELDDWVDASTKAVQAMG